MGVELGFAEFEGGEAGLEGLEGGWRGWMGVDGWHCVGWWGVLVGWERTETGEVRWVDRLHKTRWGGPFSAWLINVNGPL